DLVWASANTASWLYVTAQVRKTPPPQPDVVDLIRESVMQIILIQRPEADSK
ncbi:TetR family transcriptional regulator, partial [Paenibacillus rhizosphaerae]